MDARTKDAGTEDGGTEDGRTKDAGTANFSRVWMVGRNLIQTIVI